jgi:4-hydroxy-3-methylbut-2-enyl diphosphate reductase
MVGSANSSNTVRLVDVALENGATAAYRIDYARDPAGLARRHRYSRRHLRASVPEVLVQEVLDDLADAGYADVSPGRHHGERRT